MAILVKSQADSKLDINKSPSRSIHSKDTSIHVDNTLPIKGRWHLTQMENYYNATLPTLPKALFCCAYVYKICQSERTIHNL